jgi:hypothetical protein
MGDSAPKLLRRFFSFLIHVYVAPNLSTENHQLFAHRAGLAEGTRAFWAEVSVSEKKT